MNDVHSLAEAAELAALYLAGALPNDQLAEFEAHLAVGCEPCQEELRQLSPIISEMLQAFGAASPDPKIRENLLARAAAEARSPDAASPLRKRVLDDAARGPSPHTTIINKASEASWESTGVEGVTIRTLFVDPENNQFTALVRMAPGASYPRHIHGGPEQCLVLEGDLRAGDMVLGAGDYERAPTESHHEVQSTEGGCLLFITSSLTDRFV
jgi:predicted ChrR family anti-sigma factor